MLVHFVISGGNVLSDFDLFVSAKAMPEQAQIPTRKVAAMIDPSVQKPKSAVEIKSVHVRATNSFADFAFQLERDAFVRVDDQHPLMLPRNIFQRPILLAR